MRLLTASLLMAAIAIAAFIPGLGGGFIFDDRPNIVQNTAVHLSELTASELPFAVYSFQPGNGSRMLSMATFALDHWRNGLDPRAFKITNLAIHAITAIALTWLFFLLLVQAKWPEHRARNAALLLAAAWAVHPLQVSSVLYVVQRMQTLVTLFGVLALISYLAMRRAQMEGNRSRQHALAALLFWALGFASKEDAALYPVYALALELTLLRFVAQTSLHRRILRIGYLAFTAACICAFLFYVAPKHWHWDVLPGRDFSTVERLMTQTRILVMYLGQILVPLPSHMPFYYDTVVASQGLFHPATTFLSMVALTALIGWAWVWRSFRPVFALGIMLFFAGHALTSNILNLELAFEHRNHFPLIGILLAVGDLWALLWQRIERFRIQQALAGGALCLLAGATVVRAYEWGEPIRFAEYSLRISPDSPRAWMALGSAYYELGRGDPRSSHFSKAIEINRMGAERTGSPPMYSNIVIYKSQLGTVTQADWDNLVESAAKRPMTLQTQFILDIMLDNVERGVELDPQGMLRLIDAIAPRGSFNAHQYRRFGAYIHNETGSPEKALAYLEAAVELAPIDDPDTERMLDELTSAGRGDWAQKLRSLPRRSK